MRTQCPTCGSAGQVAVEKAGAASIARGIQERPVEEERRVVTIVVAETCRHCKGDGWSDGLAPPC